MFRSSEAQKTGNTTGKGQKSNNYPGSNLNSGSNPMEDSNPTSVVDLTLI